MLLRSIFLFCLHVWSIRGQSEAGGGGGGERPDWPDYQPFPQISGWLKLHVEPANWTTATRNCQREEAQLASPWTAAFVSAVHSLQARRVELALLYSGLHATLPFVNGEPPLSLSLSELERCGVFRAPGAGAARGAGDDVPCDTRLPYACYAPRPQAAPLGCRSKDGRPGYRYVPGVRGCLKLHARPRPWRAARLTCRLEGAVLASPWSAGFVSAARGLQRALAGDTGAPPSAFHAGVLTSFVEGAYSDVEGTPAISLEPALLTRLERCGVFLPGGDAGAVRCDTRLPFLCYAPADTADTAADTANTTDNNVPWIPAALDLTITVAPVIASSAAPTTVTTASPTTVTTFAPTTVTTAAPTTVTTAAPTTVTTAAPTTVTTAAPTTVTTAAPTTVTTAAPTTVTTAAPTTVTTAAPITVTTAAPTTVTTAAPTTVPAAAPTTLASATSTDAPTMSSSSTLSSAAPTDAAAMSSAAPTAPSAASAASAAVPITCMDESRGYKLDARFGHCYKLHVELRNWTAANVTCAAEGATLAVPNSDAEADHLRQLLEDANSAKRIGIGGFAVALGIIYEDGAWRTVDGQLLSESGYERWWPGWPSGPEQAPRGFMESTGKLENYSIYIKTPFICEKSN